MESSKHHPWMNRLLEVQKKIASRVDLEDSYSTEFVAGVDQAFLDGRIVSGAVVLGPMLEVIGQASCMMSAAFPYIPGLLSFREGPAAIRAVKMLSLKPTLLFVDGCGINHPRMAGLTSFIGVLTDLPTIGVTKNVLLIRQGSSKGRPGGPSFLRWQTSRASSEIKGWQFHCHCSGPSGFDAVIP
jgi:deoxyinosine 3'endonuclease (endonuclease V)